MGREAGEIAPCWPGHLGWGTQVSSARWTQPSWATPSGLRAFQGLCSSASGEAAVASDGSYTAAPGCRPPRLEETCPGVVQCGQQPFTGSPQPMRGVLMACESAGEGPLSRRALPGVWAPCRPVAQPGKLRPL